MNQRFFLKYFSITILTVATLVIYLALSYVLVGQYLVKLHGNDTPAFINRLVQVNKSFPNVAFWNPKEGEGVGLKYMYPPLIQIIIVALSQWTNVGLISWVKLVGFLSVSAFAFGIYTFALVRWRVWIVAFVAGLFYLLSPLAYIWLFEWGFFAESVGMVLFPWILLFFDLWLGRSLNHIPGVTTRAYGVLTAISLALGFLSHPMVALGAIFFMVIYGLGVAVFNPDHRLQRLKRLATSLLALFFVMVLLISFWLLPYQEYRRLASSGVIYGGTESGIYYNDIDLKNFFSFDLPEDADFDRFRHFSFPLAITLLLPLGAVMGLIFKKKRLILAFGASLIMMTIGVTPQILAFFSRLPILIFFNQWRVLVYPTRVLIPVVAAWGVFGLVYWVIFPFRFIQNNRWLKSLRELVITVVIIIVTGGWLWFWRNRPGEVTDRIRYGREMSQCNLWEPYSVDWCQRSQDSPLTQLTDVKQWQIPLANLRDETVVEPEVATFLQSIPGGDFWRLLVSPNGGSMRIASPFLTRNTLLHSYDNDSVLNQTIQVIYEGSFGFWKDMTYVDRPVIPELSQWFGVKYVLLNHKTDPVAELVTVGLKKHSEVITPHFYDGLGLYEWPAVGPIIDVDTRPKILVIGKDEPKYKMYELVFRKAVYNLVPYQEAILIHGRPHVTDYTPEELSQFDLVWLYGYDYKNPKDQQQSWQLLDQYLKAGGNLFVDTGWQFTAADWQQRETPEFFPTKSLVWQDLGKARDYELTTNLFDTNDINTSSFRPLIWEDQPWGVSTDSSLRDWARPILTVKGMPLVAGGSFGEGRVIWSGMNILNHIDGFDWDNEEGKLVNRLITWLLGDHESNQLVFDQDFKATRRSQDQVELEFLRGVGQGYGVYFKESWHPFWQAKVVANGQSQALKIYKAGPNFKYVFLPTLNAGDRLVFGIQLPWRYRLYQLASLAGWLGLVVFLVKPEWLKLPKLTLAKKIKRWWRADEA